MNDEQMNNTSPGFQVKEELFKMFIEMQKMVTIALRAVPIESKYFSRISRAAEQGDQIAVLADTKKEFSLEDCVVVLKWLNATNYFIKAGVAEVESVREQIEMSALSFGHKKKKKILN